MAERRLSLHVSALSDAEYEFYTSCFQDLAGDDDGPDNITDGIVGVREARAWIRGRFPNVQTSDVDTILKYFSPNLAHADTIDAGQFFAALRLVIHADEGNNVDRTLAFVQAHPPGKSRSRSASPLKTPAQRAVSQPGTSPKRPQPPLPPTPRSQSQSRLRTSTSNNPFLTAGTTPSLPPLPPRKPQPPPPLRTTPHVTTPLMRQSLQASKVGSALKQAEKMLEKERVMEVLKSSAPSSTVNRRSTSPSKPHPGVPSSSSSNEREKDREAPPLPRRRTLNLTPSYSPPLSTSSWEQVATASLPPTTKRPPPPPSKSTKPRPPPLPPKPSPDRSTVELPPPTHPDRRRTSISSSSQSHHSHSHSVDSPASEATSFEAVYGADFQVPPARVTRSKSLHSSPSHTSSSHGHHHSSPKPPPVSPLLRISSRKRPESVGVPTRQLSLLSLVGVGNANGEGDSNESSESHIAKTLDKLTKARYKAEAGLSRRGFVPDGQHHLVRHDSTGDSVDRDRDGRGRSGGGGREEYHELDSALNSDSSIDEEDLKKRRVVEHQVEGWMGPL